MIAFVPQAKTPSVRPELPAASSTSATSFPYFLLPSLSTHTSSTYYATSTFENNPADTPREAIQPTASDVCGAESSSSVPAYASASTASRSLPRHRRLRLAIMASNGGQQAFAPTDVLAAMLTLRSSEQGPKAKALKYLEEFQKSVGFRLQVDVGKRVVADDLLHAESVLGHSHQHSPVESRARSHFVRCYDSPWKGCCVFSRPRSPANPSRSPSTYPHNFLRLSCLPLETRYSFY